MIVFLNIFFNLQKGYVPSYTTRVSCSVRLAHEIAPYICFTLYLVSDFHKLGLKKLQIHI